MNVRNLKAGATRRTKLGLELEKSWPMWKASKDCLCAVSCCRTKSM